MADYIYSAVVQKVVDGDTFDLRVFLCPQDRVIHGERYFFDFGFRFYAPTADSERLPFFDDRFRLYGVNAYEMKDPRGKKAKDLVCSLMPEPWIVKVKTHKDRQGRDAKGNFRRWLAEIFDDDHGSIGELLVERGLAVRS